MNDETLHLRLSDLAYLIEANIKQGFYNKTFWIIAETSDVKNYPERGYCFVTLVEKEGKDILSKMDAVIWSRNYHIIKNFEYTAGINFDRNIQLLLHVGVDYSPQYGLKLQIYDIDPAYTTGKLELEREKILKALVAENPDLIHYLDGNYITFNKRLERPQVIQHIALITAPNSDGQRDFMHELGANQYGYSFYITEYVTQIQGRGAEENILERLDQILSSGIAFDAVAIVRGGGSQLDFSSFDTYNMGLRIASYPFMIIAGIGHERNVSIADLMCHLSVKTPTKAAGFIIQHNRMFEELVLSRLKHLVDKSRERFEDAGDELEDIAQSLIYAVENYFRDRRVELEKIQQALRHLDPERVLERGYALLMKNNKIIIDPAEIAEGDEMEARLKGKIFKVRVNSKNNLESGIRNQE